MTLRKAIVAAVGLASLCAQPCLAASQTMAQNYPPPGYAAPPPGYAPPPPCAAVTPSPLRGAARGAAGGALIGAISGNAGRGAAIGATVGGVASAARTSTARSYGACS